MKADKCKEAVKSGKFNYREASRVCEASPHFAGKRQSGSHVQYLSDNGKYTTLPRHGGNEDYPKGTASAIKAQMIACLFLFMVIVVCIGAALTVAL